MRYRNNLTYFILKQFEISEKESKLKRKKSKIDAKNESYENDLLCLKEICTGKGIDTPSKMKQLIINLENEVNGSATKNAKCVGSAVLTAAFTGCIIPIILEYLKENDWSLSLLIIICFVLFALILCAYSLVVADIKDKFSTKGKYVKLLKMLNDVNLLYYCEDSKNEK